MAAIRRCQQCLQVLMWPLRLLQERLLQAPLLRLALLQAPLLRARPVRMGLGLVWRSPVQLFPVQSLLQNWSSNPQVR